MTSFPATRDHVLSPAPLRRLQFAIALALFTVATANAGEAPLFAVKMLNPPAAPLESAVAELKTAGVRAVYCRVDNLLATPATSAHVRQFRQLLADSNIAFHITAPVFLDTAALARDPALVGIGHLGNPSREPGVAWLGFVCPARPDYRRQRQAQILNQVRELRPNGLSLDFIRYFIYWERIKPDQSADDIEKFCFCDHCLQEMETSLGFHFPADATNPTAKAAWVLANERERWTAWKCEIITSMVRDLAREARVIIPEIRVSLHGVPWREGDYDDGRRVIAGQDPRELAPHVDVFSPMAYIHMLDRKPEWVREVAEDYWRLTGKAPLVSIQAGGPRNAPDRAAAFRSYVRAAGSPPSIGVNVFDWNRLKSESEQLRIITDFAGTSPQETEAVK